MSNNGYNSELSGYNSNNSTNLKKIYKLERNINRLLRNAKGVPGYNQSDEFAQRMQSLTKPLEMARRRRQSRNVSRSTSPAPSRPSSPSTRKRKNRKTRKSRK